MKELGVTVNIISILVFCLAFVVAVTVFTEANIQIKAEDGEAIEARVVDRRNIYGKNHVDLFQIKVEFYIKNDTKRKKCLSDMLVRGAVVSETIKIVPQGE